MFVLFLNLAIYQADKPLCEYNHYYDKWSYYGIGLSAFWGLYIVLFWP